MTARLARVGAALLLAVLVALVGFRYLSGPVRDLEAAGVVAVLHLVGQTVTTVSDHTFQVLPAGHPAFRAYLTPFCSSLVSVLALVAISQCILRGPRVRRLGALLVAAAFVLVCNVLRIAASVWVGAQTGSGGLVMFHDWVGTLFGLAYTLVGFFLMLHLLLPSATDPVPRAARVSDVL